MDNKKISNLLRAVADLMDQTTEAVVETQKEVVKTVEKTNEDFFNHSLKLMKKIEENDAIRAYQNKLSKQNKNLADALKEIQKMREKAIFDMIEEGKKIKTPIDLMEKTMENFSKTASQITEEAKIMQGAMNL